jgi:hypothetical protein
MRLSTPRPWQVRTLQSLSNASAMRSMYKIKMDFPYSPGRTLHQREQDVKREFSLLTKLHTTPLY